MTICRISLIPVLVVLLLIWSRTAAAEGHFNGVRMVVGSQQLAGTLVSDTESRRVLFDTGGSIAAQMPFERIKALHYERAAKPRYAAGLLVAWPLLFTKSKQHYLTIQYADDAGAGKFVMMQLAKENFRTVLDTLEADTGVKVDRTEER